MKLFLDYQAPLVSMEMVEGIERRSKEHIVTHLWKKSLPAVLLVLLVALVLSIYKPRGMTRYGLRRSRPAAS